MATQTKSSEKKIIKRTRRTRMFGLNNSILSNTTVYLNPYTENQSHLTVEEAAMLAAVAKQFNES
jgi:hypothetical protein